MSESTLTAVIHKEKKFYAAECPEVGTVSQGLTLEEAVSNLKAATELYLEKFPRLIFSKPIFTTFEAEFAKTSKIIRRQNYQSLK
jgi:predicted RNase H-like HicB family nuclease